MGVLDSRDRCQRPAGDPRLAFHTDRRVRRAASAQSQAAAHFCRPENGALLNGKPLSGSVTYAPAIFCIGNFVRIRPAIDEGVRRGTTDRESTKTQTEIHASSNPSHFFALRDIFGRCGNKCTDPINIILRSIPYQLPYLFLPTQPTTNSLQSHFFNPKRLLMICKI